MDLERIVAELKSERDRVDQAIVALSGTRTVRRVGRPAGRKRRMSAEGRRRIAIAAKRRWAAWRKAKKQ